MTTLEKDLVKDQEPGLFGDVPQNDPSTVSSEGFTDVTVLLDKSGSMVGLREAVVESFNKHFSSLRETKGNTRWTLVDFDEPNSAKGAGESFPHTIFQQRLEKDMVPMQLSDYVPRGGTALVDAVCLTLQKVEQRTSGTQILPIVMVVTDGEENSSREFTTDKMREMIAACQQRGVEFMYLAANQDAWSVAKGYNMQASWQNTGSAQFCNTGGAITGSGGAYYYGGSSTLSGGIASGAVGSFTLSATPDGMRQGLVSGFIGISHMGSGQHFRMCNPTP